MIQWLKHKLGIVELERQLKEARQELEMYYSSNLTRIRVLQSQIRDIHRHTTLDADIGHRGECTVIMIGRFRGRDYVQSYDMSVSEFSDYAKYMEDAAKRRVIRVVDKPPMFHLGKRNGPL